MITFKALLKLVLEDREDLSLTCKVYLLVAELNDSFCEYTKELLKATSLQGEEVEVNKLFSSRWILSNLSANLKHHTT